MEEVDSIYVTFIESLLGIMDENNRKSALAKFCNISLEEIDKIFTNFANLENKEEIVYTLAMAAQKEHEESHNKSR